MPCPLTSVMASPGTKLAVPSIWPARSGWFDVDAGVEHRDRDARAVVARPPRPRARRSAARSPSGWPRPGRRATAWRRPRPAWASGRSASRCGRDGGPEGAGLRLRRWSARRRRMTGSLRASLLPAGRRRLGGARAFARVYVAISGTVPVLGVVVAHLDQVGDVEQPPVQLVRAEQRARPRPGRRTGRRLISCMRTPPTALSGRSTSAICLPSAIVVTVTTSPVTRVTW